MDWAQEHLMAIPVASTVAVATGLLHAKNTFLAMCYWHIINSSLLYVGSAPGLSHAETCFYDMQRTFTRGRSWQSRAFANCTRSWSQRRSSKKRIRSREKRRRTSARKCRCTCLSVKVTSAGGYTFISFSFFFLFLYIGSGRSFAIPAAGYYDVGEETIAIRLRQPPVSRIK